MSSGQKPRAPEFFPKMKVRGLRRRQAAPYDIPQFVISDELASSLMGTLVKEFQKIPADLFKRHILLGGEDDPNVNFADYFKEELNDTPQAIRSE